MTNAGSDRTTTGVVTSFDEHAGLGELTASDGKVLAFQCIGIADGTRTIEVGTPVSFERLAKLGRYEATNITPR
jgi:cold shock CspA family protein